MNICRVYYRADGSVAVVHPAPQSRRVIVVSPSGERREYKARNDFMAKVPALRQSGVTVIVEDDRAFLDRVYAEAEATGGLAGLDYEELDPVELPDRVEREKWRGGKGLGVKIDPAVVTEKDRRLQVEADLDAELASPQPDPVTVIRLKRKLDKRDY